jgi:hypothetical protein
LVPQTISTQLLPAFAVCGVHVATGRLAVAVVHVTPTHPLPGPGGSGVQVAA